MRGKAGRQMYFFPRVERGRNASFLGGKAMVLSTYVNYFSAYFLKASAAEFVVRKRLSTNFTECRVC